MNRLTDERRLKGNQEVRLFATEWQKLYRRLQAYEDTGLEPEEITDIQTHDFEFEAGMLFAWRMANRAILCLTDGEFEETFGTRLRLALLDENPLIVRQKLINYRDKHKAAPPDPGSVGNVEYAGNELSAALKIARSMSEEDRRKYLYEDGISSLYDLAPETLIARINEYKAAKQKADDEIHVGDVCVYKNGTNPPFIVTRIYWEEDGSRRMTGFFDGLFNDGSVLQDGTLSIIKKVDDFDGIEMFKYIVESGNKK